VRVDYLYADNQFFFMEINTVPGMSPNSIIPKQLDAEKLDVSDILSKVVENAGYNL
jgi:D-alanine-D-alanine ligase